MQGLSLKDTAQHLEKSPLLKFRSAASQDSVTGKWYFVGIALRENGRVEIYSDFIYVDQFHDPNMQCVDIETGSFNFYFKMVKNARNVTNETKFE